MRNLGLLLLALGILFTGCREQKTMYTINGTWDGGDGNVVYLKKALGDKEYEIVDSAVVKNGVFKMQNELKEVGERTLVINNAQNIIILDSVPFTVTCENVTKTVKGKETKSVKTEIKGSIEQDIFKTFLMAQRDEMFVMLGISFMSKDAQENPAMMDSVVMMYDAVKKRTAHTIDSLVTNYPDTYVAAIIINNVLTKQLEIGKVEELYANLTPRVKASSPGQKLQETIEIMKKAAVGSVAPDFTLKTPDGKDVSLSDYKGKYVLLDFWASWCGPCLREVPNVKKMYDKYHPMGFEILSVSLDDKKDNWTNAIEKYDLNWGHVSSLEGWKCPVVKLYSVSGVPAMFLIDKDGKIVSSDLRGEKLMETVSALYES